MSDGREDSKLPIISIITIGIGVAAFLLFQEPLKSSRPLSEGIQTTTSASVDARLWEDPMAAVQAHEKLDTERDENLSSISGDKKTRNTHDSIRIWKHWNKKKTAVLLVMTDGRPYPESAETRINDRYAVVSALGIGCFTPTNQGYIQYFKLGTPPRNVPYIWHEQRMERRCPNPLYENVLEVWLDDQALQEQPLHWLEQLTQKLCKESDKSHNCESLEFRIIGPHNGDTLLAMFKEAQVGHEKPHWPHGSIQLYSPWVTIPYPIFEDWSPGSDPKLDTDRRKIVLKARNVEMKYEITSDDYLFEELLDEFKKREIDYATDSIILLGEWDTLYSRSLALSFYAMVCKKAYGNKSQGNEPACVNAMRPNLDKGSDALRIKAWSTVLGNPTHQISNVRRYTYLRGLDGFTARKATSLATKNNARDKSSREHNKDSSRDTPENNAAPGNLERPEGESQYDYIRRLVSRIKNDNPNVKAIGVLGTDVYDELLILQALKPAFPGVVFFSNDLDARLLYKDQYKWTRNLLIASAFGLELKQDLQRDIPPFRNSYQTSTYFSVLQAIGDLTFSWSDLYSGLRVDNYYSTSDVSHIPRLFEVGRNGPINLSQKDPTIDPNPPPLFPESIRLEYPFFKTGDIGFRVQALIVVCLTALFLISVSQVARKHWLLILGLLLVTALALLVFAWYLELPHNQNAVEPFALSSGASSWPAVVIRYVIIVLGFFWFRRAWVALADNAKKMTKSFSLTKLNRPLLRECTLWESICWPFPTTITKRALKRSEINDVWINYQRAGSLWPSISRIFIMFVLLGSFAFIVFGALGIPSAPCRGTLNCVVNRWILVGSIVCFAALNLFVFDATRLCKTFIDNLIDSEPIARASWCLSGYKELIDMIGERTEVVGKLVYYPFILFVLLVLSRNTYWDDWDFPPSLIIIWLVNGVIVLSGAYFLKSSAENARNRALLNLRRGLLRSSLSMDKVRLIMEEIKTTQQGSFDHILQQPAVAGGVLSALAVLQYYFPIH